RRTPSGSCASRAPGTSIDPISSSRRKRIILDSNLARGHSSARGARKVDQAILPSPPLLARGAEVKRHREPVELERAGKRPESPVVSRLLHRLEGGELKAIATGTAH